MSNTTNIALSTPAHGANTDTWDADPINNNSNILDSCFGSVLSLSAVSTTLGNTNAQKAVLKWTGTISSNVTCTISGIIKTWTVLNNSSGSFNIVLSTGTGNAIGVPPGEPTDVFSDGTNFYFKNLGPVPSYVDFATADTPGWVSACTVPPLLKCNGSSFSAVTYPVLAAALGTTTLPDLKGRARFFLNDGSSRITTAGSGVDGDTRFSSGGSQTTILVASNIPLVTAGSATANSTFTATGNYVLGIAGGGGTETGGTGGSRSVGTITGTVATAISNVTVGTASPTGAPNMPPAQIAGICMIRAA